MGAGGFGAGLGGFGDDPVADPSAPRAVVLPAALYLKGSTLDYPLNSAGLYQLLHPVDAWVALALVVRRGTLASVPTAGQRLREITRIGNKRAISQATDLVNLALKERVDNGDITIRKITVESTGGRLSVAVEYVNNRLKPATFTTRTLTSG
jgi:hypothetical protein